MSPLKDKDEVIPLRHLVHEVIKNQQKMMEETQKTNIELIKHAYALDKLKDDNIDHKKYIEGDKKFKYGAVGILGLITIFKEQFFNIFTK